MPEPLRQVVREVRSTLGRMEQALAVLDDCLIWTDVAGRVTWCTPSFARLLGKSYLEVLDQGLVDLLPLNHEGSPVAPADHPATRLFATAELGDSYVTRLAGRDVVLDLWARRLRLAGRDEGLFVVRDVTERVRRERALRAMNTRLEGAQADLENMRFMLEAVRDYAIFMLDPHGHVTLWSPGAEATTGFAADEVLGRHFSIFYTEEDRRRDHPTEELRTAMADGRYEEEGWRLRKDGSRYWANVVITPIRDAYGRHLGFSKVSRDVTERRLVEEELREANRQLETANAELEAFSYSVSHDLRTPLRALDGFSQALLEDYAETLDSEGKDYLSRIRAAAQRMATLIDDMLQLSRVTRTPLRRQPVDLSALARSILSDLRADSPERDVAISVADGLVVHGDPHLLHQLLENLLQNAWKFTGKTEHARIELGGEKGEDETIFFVRDNGAGFDMAFGERLFGAFQRLHTSDEFQGTGIGLAIVRRIAHRHGGRTWAEGAVGQGATFYVALPQGASNGEPEGGD